MKIAITGHTRGIGQAIYNSLINTHSVIGLSKSNGYDINHTETIINAVKDCDCFVNNAYSDLQQEILLKEINDLWQGQNKLIINVGSAVTDYPRLEAKLNDEPWDYRDNKQALVKTFRQLVYAGTDQPLLKMLTPGAVDTNMIKHIDCVKLDPKEIAHAIDILINNPYIKEMTVKPYYGK